VKSAASREEVYIFAETAFAAGYAEVGAAAVICLEWLQRPENVLAGYIRWTDYRNCCWCSTVPKSRSAPTDRKMTFALR
jgi:hypothetical protein